MKKPFIVICGNMRNGKDTFANFAFERLCDANLVVHRTALADELRSYIGEYFQPMFREYNTAIELTNREMQSFVGSNPWYEPRETLAMLNSLVTGRQHIFGEKNVISRMVHQALGECIRHKVDPTHWVRSVVEKIPTDAEAVVLTDMRWSEDIAYLNEHLSDKYEIVLVKVNRLGGLVLDERVSENSSERSLSDDTHYHYTVDANSVDDLSFSANIIVKNVLELCHAD